jgi:N-acetylated-alpha-linked acidic dipeptidase
MKRLLAMSMGCLAAVVAHAAGVNGVVPVQEAQTEQEFQRQVSAENIGSYIKELTQHPNFPGSPFAKRNAEWILNKFLEWGWEAKIETFSVPFPRPTIREVELVQPTRYRAKLHEPIVDGDPYSAQQSEHLEPYFIYGPDGDITAPLVYVNFGLREDYAQLERMGVSVKGAIVIIRYGKLWRGGKVELAAEQGALGALIYSDPHEDGYFQGPTYPSGPWRSADAVQRGSVLNGKYPGDPLTPFVGATADAQRLAISKAESLARIPSLPLSYGDAEPLLRAMGGPTAPETWRGALPITYRIGPGPAQVHLRVAFKWDSVEFYDVIARLAGSTYPNEWVIRGNHHDGWVYGAQDPHSGHSALLEEARVLGLMHKAGWRPKRTIIYASWDGEEQGTIGSTEWMEAHFKELQQKGVLYLNSDVTMVGLVDMSGSPSLESFLRGVAADVKDPVTGQSSLERAEENIPKGEHLSVGPPGYGSDHHAFVARSGIPTVNLDFSGAGFGGAYHSSYDNYAWYTRFNDPGFLYGRATAQLIGTAVLRFADSTLLPFDFQGTASAIKREFVALKRLYGVDQTQHPALDLSPIETAVAAIDRSAEHFTRVRNTQPVSDLSGKALAKVNASLLRTERAFLREQGLPGRPYYQNEVYSPGRLWDTVPLPALGDAILDERWQEAADQIPKVAQTLSNIAQAINTAAEALENHR